LYSKASNAVQTRIVSALRGCDRLSLAIASRTSASTPKIGARSTIRLQRVEIKKNAPSVAARANKKRLGAERHFAPCHGDDLRRLTAFFADPENADVIAGGFKMLKRKPHRLAKCARFGQRADIDFAAMIGSDRVQLAMAHGNASIYLGFLSIYPSYRVHVRKSRPLGDVPDGGTMTEIEIFFVFALFWAVIGLIWLRRSEGKIKPPEN
jgi:hypothetical protein